MKDLGYLCQAYERRQIFEVLWINSHQNARDALDKENSTNTLIILRMGI